MKSFVAALVLVAAACVPNAQAFVDSSRVRFSYRYSVCPVQGQSCTPQASFSASYSESSPRGVQQRLRLRGPGSGDSALAAGDGGEDLLAKVKAVVAEQLGVDIARVKPESHFMKDLEADSLDSVELVMAFEEKFGVSIPDEEATKITTVQEAVDYIEKHKS